MPTDQVTFTEAERLVDHDVAEALLAGGVRCHSGFTDERHPRVTADVPSRRGRRATGELFGTDLLGVLSPSGAAGPTSCRAPRAGHPGRGRVT
jgi:hypothetical protein